MQLIPTFEIIDTKKSFYLPFSIALIQRSYEWAMCSERQTVVKAYGSHWFLRSQYGPLKAGLVPDLVIAPYAVRTLLITLQHSALHLLDKAVNTIVR